MELVCIDFWSAEDSKQHSVDVLVVTDHFTKLAHATLAPIKRRSKLQENFGTMRFGSTGSLKEYTPTRAPVSRATS